MTLSYSLGERFGCKVYRFVRDKGMCETVKNA